MVTRFACLTSKLRAVTDFEPCPDHYVVSSSKALYSTCSIQLSWTNEYQHLLGYTCNGSVSCPKRITDSHPLGLTCNGLVSCPGGVTDSHPLGANLQWISVLSRGSHRLSSPGDYPVMDQCPVQGESQTLISWGLPCNGLVFCPG